MTLDEAKVISRNVHGAVCPVCWTGHWRVVRRTEDGKSIYCCRLRHEWRGSRDGVWRQFEDVDDPLGSDAGNR